MGALSLSLSLSPSLSLAPSPSFVSSQGDEGAALWAVEEVRGSPGSSHSAAACLFAVVRLRQSLPLTLSLSVRACVRVAFPPASPLLPSHWFLFPPASRAPVPLWAVSPLISRSFRSAVFPTLAALAPRLPRRPGWFKKKKKFKKRKIKKVGYSFLLLTKKAFVVACSLVWPVVFFFPPLFPPTCLFPRSPSLPSPLPGWGVCGELETLAGRAAENESTKQQNASAWILEMSLKPRLVFLSPSLSPLLARSLTHSHSLSLCKEVGQQMVLAVITLTFTT